MLGETRFDTATVALDKGLLQVERRSTIAHELEHIARGPVPDDAVLAAREELWVERAAARKLIPLDAWVRLWRGRTEWTKLPTNCGWTVGRWMHGSPLCIRANATTFKGD